MADWKLILSTEKKEVVNNKDGTTRIAEIATVVTNDSRQFVLGDWEVCDKAESMMEIDGKHYKNFGETLCYSRDLARVVESYIDKKKKFSPSKDIKTWEDVCELYQEMQKELQSILSMVRS